MTYIGFFHIISNVSHDNETKNLMKKTMVSSEFSLFEIELDRKYFQRLYLLRAVLLQRIE